MEENLEKRVVLQILADSELGRWENVHAKVIF